MWCVVNCWKTMGTEEALYTHFHRNKSFGEMFLSPKFHLFLNGFITVITGIILMQKQFVCSYFCKSTEKKEAKHIKFNFYQHCNQNWKQQISVSVAVFIFQTLQVLDNRKFLLTVMTRARVIKVLIVSFLIPTQVPVSATCPKQLWSCGSSEIPQSV